MGTPEQLVLVMSEQAMGDNPIWYDETGELRPFKHLWYSAERVVQYVQEACGADQVFMELVRIDAANAGGSGSASVRRGGRFARRWTSLRNGSQRYVGAIFVDDLFAARGLVPFTVALGAPDVASKCSPGSTPAVPLIVNREMEAVA